MYDPQVSASASDSSPVRARSRKIKAAALASGPLRETEFSYHAPEARLVFLAWNPENLPMRREPDGHWRLRLPLAPGQHEYRFIADGIWSDDPHACAYRPNPGAGAIAWSKWRAEATAPAESPGRGPVPRSPREHSPLAMPFVRLIFVYNEGSGFFNAMGGWAHKLLSPQTYQCVLCRTTSGLTGMLVPWKNYLERLDIPKEFLHRDEFRRQHPQLGATPLPVILAERAGRIEVLLSAEDIRAASGVAGLISRLQLRLERWTVAAANPS